MPNQPTPQTQPSRPAAARPNPFQRAVKTQSRARVAIAGPTGCGKTYSALRIAVGLAGPEGTIALLDSEAASANKYADLFVFDSFALPTGHPQRYIDAIKDAEAAGYTVLVIDSLSHAWKGNEGILQQVDAAKSQGNEFAAWNAPSRLHQRLVDAIVQSRLHIIATMRSHMDYILVSTTNASGHQVQAPRSVGMAPIQRDEMPYEFDVFGMMDLGHNLSVTKSRVHRPGEPTLQDQVIPFPDEALGETLRAWLSEGAPVVEPVTLTDEHLRGYAEASQKVPPERRAEFYARWLPSHGVTGSREEQWQAFRLTGRPIADAGLAWLRGETNDLGPVTPGPKAVEEPAAAQNGQQHVLAPMTVQEPVAAQEEASGVPSQG